MKIVTKLASRMAKISLKSAKSASCSASLFSYYQPKEPKLLKAKK